MRALMAKRRSEDHRAGMIANAVADEILCGDESDRETLISISDDEVDLWKRNQAISHLLDLVVQRKSSQN